MLSADKMMNRALGPVWHPKQKNQGILPPRLRGVDREATWCFSYADGWIYGHGSFCLVPHGLPIVGLFVWMPNSAHEAKRLEGEILIQRGLVRKVCMDSKADDQQLYARLRDQHHIQLVTVMRPKMIKSESRRKMHREMWTRANQKLYRERGTTVEPMQGLVKTIFDLDHCWMRGEANNRWLFAAMGIAVQLAQLRAIRLHQSTWNIQSLVLGV